MPPSALDQLSKWISSLVWLALDAMHDIYEVNM